MTVAELIRPDAAYRSSFVAAVREDPRFFAAATVPPPAQLDHDETFERYLRQLRDDEQEGSGRAEHLVPQTTLWWVEGGEFLARIGIRHRLNDRLRWFGGHIGYWTRPSARRRGHARAAFLASLPFAHELGIDPALVTCDPTNGPSRRIIETSGGVFETETNGKRLYWVPTDGR